MTVKGFGAGEQVAYDEQAIDSGVEEADTALAGETTLAAEGEDEFDLPDDDDGQTDWKTESTDASLIPEPSRASRQEDEWIATMVEGKDEPLKEAFYR